jgi:glyoxylase-like metal-dependent hydrolase (beta-lactamase superfamily II)
MTRPDDILDYEFDATPDLGALQRVHDNITWLRMPMPFALDHINLWLVRDTDGWATVDTGLRTKESVAVWHNVNGELLDNRGLTRVIVTHMHPDHVGMAGWLCEQYGVHLWMTRSEYFVCRVLSADTGKSAPTDGVLFYRAAGLADEHIERYKRMFGMFGKAVHTLPDSYIRMCDGDHIEMADMTLEVVMGNGHSPEHACLFSAQENVLISGDQVLPTISSNVSVWPTEPHANPLQDWLDSCHRLRERLPEDVLVLPAHGRPFRGVAKRLTQLIDEHEEGLSKVLDQCAAPQRAADLFPSLFDSTITDSNRIMATGETMANINYLLARGELGVDSQTEGVTWYRRT